MPGKVFISYSSADQETANKLVLEIQRRGIPCWISSHDIPPGEDYQKAIVTAVKDAGVFLLLFSENANKSTEIPHELALAGKYKKTVIPARLQDIVPSDAFAYQMTSSQFIDLFHDFDAKINELCMRLAELLQISEDVAHACARTTRGVSRNKTRGVSTQIKTSRYPLRSGDAVYWRRGSVVDIHATPRNAISGPPRHRVFQRPAAGFAVCRPEFCHARALCRNRHAPGRGERDARAVFATGGLFTAGRSRCFNAPRADDNRASGRLLRRLFHPTLFP